MIGYRSEPILEPVITVGSLIEFDELYIRPIAGLGGLEVQIRWAHVSELEDPTPWLQGGELIMTAGIGVPRGASRQVEYLRRLHAVGAAGVAIGDRMYAPPLTPAALAFADAHDLPLLLVEREVPFIALAQTVAAANRDALHARLARHLRVYETLHDVARATTDVRQLFARLAAVTGFDLYPITPAGEPLFAEVDPPPEPVPTARIVQCLESSRPVVVHFESDGGLAGSLLPIIAKHTRLGVLAAFQRHTGEPEQLILHHVATIASLIASELLHDREQRRRAGSERFARLLSEVDRFARGFESLFPDVGRDDAAWFVVAHLAEPAIGWDDVHHRLLDADIQHVLLRRGRSASFVATGPPSLGEALPEVLAAALPGSTFGLGAPTTVGGDGEAAFEEASWALQHALAHDQRWHVFSAADAALPTDAAEVALMVRRVLGNLLAYDARTKGELYRTLATFLGENRSWKTTAARLGIHRQTLVYRIRRVEELTGRSLATTQGLCDLWLAVRARETAVPVPGGSAGEVRARAG